MTFHSTTSRSEPAKGAARTNRYGHKLSPRVMVSLDRALFERLADEAGRLRVPIAAVIREKIRQAVREAGA